MIIRILRRVIRRKCEGELMGQWEVLEFLEEHPKKWFSILEIADALHISEGSACTSCLRLRKSNLVCFKTEKRALSNRANYNLIVHKYKKVVKK